MSEKKLFESTPASCTVFHVQYQFRKPARTDKVPGAAKREDDKVSNGIVITSGDPSGRDVYDITRRLVLGETPYVGNDFRVLQCAKMVDAMGLVQVTTWDKLDGSAPEVLGVEIQTADSKDDDDSGGGSVPPAANMN